MSFPSLTLVMGGASSGKSSFAEALITATGRPRTYIATSEPRDAEMTAKIKRHQQDRGPNWHTIEEPLDIASALAGVPADGIVLIDCATLWLSNWLEHGGDGTQAGETFVDALRCAAPIVVVSNELSGGLVPMEAGARAFQRHHGRMNAAIAARAELAVMVIAGLPQVLKGELP